MKSAPTLLHTHSSNYLQDQFSGDRLHSEEHMHASRHTHTHTNTATYKRQDKENKIGGAYATIKFKLIDTDKGIHILNTEIRTNIIKSCRNQLGHTHT